MQEHTGRGVSRRHLLGAGLALGGAGVLAACAATPTPQVIRETVVVTQEVEKVVERTVEVEKVVERTVEVEVTAAPSALAGELKVWVFPMGENDMDTLWTPLVGRFRQQYPNINLNIELLPWGGRREKMLTAFAAGEAPDVAYVNTDTLSLFGTNDVLTPLDDVVPQEAWDDLYGNLQPGLTWEGRRLMYPALLIGTGHLYNKGLFSEMGLDPEQPPVTWDEIREVGAASVAHNYFLTTWSTTDWGNCWVTVLWQAGGNVYSEDLTRVLLDSDEAFETLSFATEMFQNGWVPKEGAVGSEAEAAAISAINYWIEGRSSLSGFGNPDITTNTRAQAPEIDFGLNPVWKNKRQVCLGGAGCWGVFKGSKAPEATAAWLNWLIEPEQQGFYGSVTKFAPPRRSAWDYWAAEPLPKQFVAMRVDLLEMNQDSSYFWQEGKVTCAPYFQAAVLGYQSVEEALAGAQAELHAIVDEWNASRS
ncbi:MAG: extracellular solute-binding protein [Anaerolineae bacterium]|nr:extracellular solute-binding protein [Anaerolineae bacterium]